MHLPLARLFVLLAFVTASITPHDHAYADLDWLKKSNLSKEPGEMRLEDFMPDPLKLRIKQEAYIYYQSKRQRVLGTMYPGTEVTLVSLNDKSARVRGRAAHGDVAGWIHPSELDGLNPQLLQNLKKAHQRQEKVAQLIENKQVALGMTTEEVHAALGKPDRKSSRITAQGQSLTLEYITYDRVPQRSLARDRFGRTYYKTVYIRVETGRMSLHFQDQVLQSIEESEGQPDLSPLSIHPPYF